MSERSELTAQRCCLRSCLPAALSATTLDLQA
jgi:hypothetical protein